MGLLTAAIPGLPSWAWRVLFYTVLVVSIGGFIWVKGDEHGTEKLTDYKSKEALATVVRQKAQAAVVAQADRIYVPVLHTIIVKGDTIIKEVPVYVTKEDDDHCVIPVGFVREHDAALANEPATPPTESDRADSGHSLSQLATVDAQNAKSLALAREKLKEWNDFYAQLSKVQER